MPRKIPLPLKAGKRCDCGRDFKGRSSLLTNTIYCKGQEPKDVCQACADEAPLGTLVRKLGTPAYKEK